MKILWGNIFKTLLICTIVLMFLLPVNFFIEAEGVKNVKTNPTRKTTSVTNEYNRVLYVDDDNINGPWDGSIEHPYQHIKDAIENASDYDEIYVFKGMYNENLLLNKPIKLLGEDINDTILDGTNNGTVVSISADNTTIENFTIRNSGGFKKDAGVKINSNYNRVVNCIIYRNRKGIYISNSSHDEVIKCIFHTNGKGLTLESSFENSIKNCYFSHNALGIDIQKSKLIDLFNCYANINGIGLFIDKSSNIDISHSAFYNNNDNQGGISIGNSQYVTLTNCNIYHNGFGIKTYNSSSIWINRCNITWTTHFATMITKQSRDITISSCNISCNFRYGIYIEENSYANIHFNNIFKNTLYGVFCDNGFFNAQYNWWGSIFGPSRYEIGKGDRITQKNKYNRYIPWRIKPLEKIGSNWMLDPSYKINVTIENNKTIPLEGKDSDDDGVPDWWEIKYGYDPYIWDDHSNLDPDNDGLNNVEECYTDKLGSNPFHKDIFLEFDWVARYTGDTTNKPSGKYVEKMVSTFEKHNISLHIDNGTLGGGEEIPYISNFSYSDLVDIYWDYFLHNDLNNPRKGIFHYSLICYYGPGPGFAFVGWDNLDSFDISAQMQKNKHKLLNRQLLIIGGSIHELGHTLGLFVDDHGGIDNMGDTKILSLEWVKYRNYKSCMNYLYTYRIINYSDGSHGRGDFDDWSNLDFTFFKNTHFEWPK